MFRLTGPAPARRHAWREGDSTHRRPEAIRDRYITEHGGKLRVFGRVEKRDALRRTGTRTAATA